MTLNCLIYIKKIFIFDNNRRKKKLESSNFFSKSSLKVLNFNHYTNIIKLKVLIKIKSKYFS